MTDYEFPETKLTPGEQRVFDCLLDGLNYKETALKLIISEKTVKTHVSQIFGKKGVNSLSKLLAAEYKKIKLNSRPLLETKINEGLMNKQKIIEQIDELKQKVEELEKEVNSIEFEGIKKGGNEVKNG